MEIKDILKLSGDEIFDFIVKNPEMEDDIINNLKLKDRTKFFKVSSDLKSYKLNERGSAAIKKNLLENITKGKAVLNLRTKNIKPNPGQPRKIFNEEKLKELSESIRTHGLLQPIVVVENGNEDYTLIAGERRLRAHILANIETIDAIVVDADALVSRKLAIIENLHRDNLSPMEEGLSYFELQKEGGYSIRDLEDVVNAKKNYIDIRLNLTKFDEDCIDFILKQDLRNVSKMLKILKTESTVHKILLEKLARKELSDEDIEKFSIDKIEKLPDEKLPKSKSAKTIEVDHDKFNDSEDFSKEKKEAVVAAITEKVVNEEAKTDKADIIKETSAVQISGDKNKKVLISIDIESLTGTDLAILKEFIESI